MCIRDRPCLILSADQTEAVRHAVPVSYTHLDVYKRQVFVLSWLYSQAMSGAKALADFGILSFSALAQLAPAVVLAVYRPRLPSGAVLAGIVLGSLVWVWLMLVPTAMQAGLVPQFDPGNGLRWLTPENFLGLGGMHSVARGVLVSLLVNVATVFLVAHFTPIKPDAARGGIAMSALENVAQRFLSLIHI